MRVNAGVSPNAAYILPKGVPAKNRTAIVIIYIELLSPNAVLPKLLPAGRWRSQDALRQKACGIGQDGGAGGFFIIAF